MFEKKHKDVPHDHTKESDPLDLLNKIKKILIQLNAITLEALSCQDKNLNEDRIKIDYDALNNDIEESKFEYLNENQITRFRILRNEFLNEVKKLDKKSHDSLVEIFKKNEKDLTPEKDLFSDDIIATDSAINLSLNLDILLDNLNKIAKSDSLDKDEPSQKLHFKKPSF